MSIPLNPRTPAELRAAFWQAQKADDEITDELAAHIAVAVVAAAAFGTDGMVLQSDGVGRGAESSGILSANLVTAAANYGAANQIIVASGTTKAVQSDAIMSTNLVTAAAAFAATGKLIESSTTGKGVQVTAINTADVVVSSGIANMVTAAAVFANDNRLVRSDGAVRGAQASGVYLTDTDQMGVRAQEYEAGTDAGVYVEVTGSATSGVLRGVHARTIHNAGVDASSASTAIWGEGKTGGSDNLNHIVGVQAYADHEGTGTLTEMFGVNARLFSSHVGVITNMYGVQIVAPSTGAVNITNAYGLHISDFGAAAGTLNYSIYCGTGLVRFNGRVNANANLGVNIADAAPARALEVSSGSTANNALFRTTATSCVLTVQDNTSSLNFGASGSFGHFIYGTGAIDLRLMTDTTDRWRIKSDGHFFAHVDATYDIGDSTHRPRDVFASRYGRFGTSIGVGLTAASTPGSVIDTELVGAVPSWQNTVYWTNTNGPRIVYRKANGTQSSPTAVALGDTLGVFGFAGHRNSAFPSLNADMSALFEVIVHGGAVSGSSVPSAFSFATTAAGNTVNTLRMLIDSVGGVGIIDSTANMPGTHTRCLVLQVGSALASMVASTAGFHAAAFGNQTAEMYVTNSAGSRTLLTDVHYNTTGYGAGTNYTLTATAARVDRGTTDSDVILVEPGEFNIRAAVTLFYNAATFAAGQTITLKLRNATAGTDITNSSITLTAFQLTAFTGSIRVELPEVAFNNPGTNRTIQIWASVSALPSAGTLEISADNIFAYKRQ